MGSRSLRGLRGLVPILFAVVCASAGCRIFDQKVRTLSSSAPNLVLIVCPNPQNPHGQVTLALDGVTIFRGALNQERRFALSTSPGWHRLDTYLGEGYHHTTVVNTAAPKWVRIAREPSKAEGVGVHVTEFPQ